MPRWNDDTAASTPTGRSPAVVAAVAGAGTIAHLATLCGSGTITGAVVGPGPSAGSQRAYLSFQYRDSALEIVAENPDTGAARVFPTPGSGIEGAGSLLAHPNGKIYFGSWRPDRLLALDPVAGTLTDLGRVTTTESHIWGGLALGADGKVYGGTFPGCRLFRYDPVTGRKEVLGRMSAADTYITRIVGSPDGFIYAATGYAERHLMAYRISDGATQDLLPAPSRSKPAGASGQATQVLAGKGEDGKIYAEVRDSGRLTAVFRLQAFTAVPVPPEPVTWGAEHLQLRDGRRIASVAPGSLKIGAPVSGTTRTVTFPYGGKEISIFRIGIAPDGQLYGTPYQSGAELFRVAQRPGS